VVLELKPYDVSREQEWSAFVLASNEGTIFHDLEFLQYHEARFKRCEHHLAWYKGSTLFGLMPLAILPEQDGLVAMSPYGASYGGPVFTEALNYAECKEVVITLLKYLHRVSVPACRITLPIQCCYRKYSETFRLVLLEQGFHCVNRDISSVVPLGTDKSVSETMNSEARNHARKAKKFGIQIAHNADVEDFAVVLTKTHERLGTRPTHTEDELRWLHDRLKDRIYFDVAYLDNVPIAGVALFVVNARVNSSFYLSQDPEKRNLQGLTLLVQEVLERSRFEGFLWFDFGTSSASQKGRANLFEFKESFGAVGQFRETYTWTADQG
jgi:hypothetical protein